MISQTLRSSERHLACPSVRYQDSCVLKLYSGFWSSATPRLGRLPLPTKRSSSRNIQPFSHFQHRLSRFSAAALPSSPPSLSPSPPPFPSSYPPLPSPRFHQSLESSRLRGTSNVTAISRSVPEEDGGRNVEHDCQTRNSFACALLRCSLNQYEKSVWQVAGYRFPFRCPLQSFARLWNSFEFSSLLVSA